MELAVVFTLDDRTLALPLATVERVVRAVAITPLPGAPAAVSGVVDMHGEVVPVLDVRRHFDLAPRPLDLGDQIIIVLGPRRRLAVIADQVGGVVAWEQEDFSTAETLIPERPIPLLKGVMRGADGLTLVYDLEAFLSPEACQILEEAIDHV